MPDRPDPRAGQAGDPVLDGSYAQCAVAAPASVLTDGGGPPT